MYRFNSQKGSKCTCNFDKTTLHSHPSCQQSARSSSECWYRIYHLLHKIFCWSDLFLSFLVCVMVSVCLFRYHDRSVFITEIVQHTLLSTGADSSSSLFVFRFFLTILACLFFHTNLRINLSHSGEGEGGGLCYFSLFLFFFWIKSN